jgi:hypothetical protein
MVLEAWLRTAHTPLHPPPLLHTHTRIYIYIFIPSGSTSTTLKDKKKQFITEISPGRKFI